jgi:hypothetical protein
VIGAIIVELKTNAQVIIGISKLTIEKCRKITQGAVEFGVDNRLALSMQ